MLRKPAFPADLKVYPTLTEPLKKLQEQILFLFAHGTKCEGVRSEALTSHHLGTEHLTSEVMSVRVMNVQGFTKVRALLK